MELVIGIGGVLFRACDPEGLAECYRTNLGIQSQDGHAHFSWQPKNWPNQSGRTGWSIFAEDTDYFGETKPAFMINYVVRDLERMLEQLRKNGVKVEKVEAYDYGKFARITDPEGKRIDLWEPSGQG
jgi:predicted enzyme related to lactoylglutathione lyase